MKKKPAKVIKKRPARNRQTIPIGRKIQLMNEGYEINGYDSPIVHRGKCGHLSHAIHRETGLCFECHLGHLKKLRRLALMKKTKRA